MIRTISMGLVILILVGCLGLTFFLSYSGVGITSAGGPSARQGSVWGLPIIGGGPGSGK